jgi:hypothetical protein
MKTWPRHPVIFEVNTWAWLNDLSGKHKRVVDLSTVPEQEWDAIRCPRVRRCLVHVSHGDANPRGASFPDAR